MSVQSAPLRAFLTSLDDWPSFVTPIFGDDKKTYYQIIGDNEIVEDLHPLRINTERSLLLDAPNGVRTAKGQEALYAFAFGPKEVVWGPRVDIAHILRSRLNEPALEQRPFLRLDIAQFIKDPHAVNESLQRATLAFKSPNRRTAIDWRVSVSDELEQFLPESAPSELWEKLTHFSLALMRLYRRYRRFLGISDEQTRRFREADYKDAAREVLRFYFDPEFFQLLRRELRRVATGDQLPLPFAISTDEYVRFRAKTLEGFGVSRNSAQRFLNTVFTAPDAQFRIASDPLFSILTADQMMFDEAIIAKRLNSAEKKLRKQQLTAGALSLSYGIIFLFRSHELERSSRFEQSSKYRALALRALAAALRDDNPSAEIRREPIGLIGPALID